MRKKITLCLLLILPTLLATIQSQRSEQSHPREWIEVDVELETADGDLWNSSDFLGQEPVVLICCESIEQFQLSPDVVAVADRLISDHDLKTHVVLVSPKSDATANDSKFLFIPPLAREVFAEIDLPSIAVIKRDGMGTEYKGTSVKEILELLQ